MYTVSKGPSKIVAKTRRGLTQNYEKFETIKESGKRSEKNSPENMHVPRPVFQAIKKPTVNTKQTEEEIITPQHEEIIKYINDSWNILVAHNPYDIACSTNGIAHSNGSSSSPSSSTASCISSSMSASTSSSASSASSSTCSSPVATPPPNAAGSIYCVEPPSPVLSDFKPFDLESWWGRRLFNNITKSL